MKVNADVFPIREIKGGELSEGKSVLSEKPAARADRVTLSEDMLKIVIEENRAASETDLVDFKNAEEALASLQSRLLKDTAAASEAHQFIDKKVLFSILMKP